MRPIWLAPAVVAALFAFALVAGAAGSGQASAQTPGEQLTISLSKSEVSTQTGRNFDFTSEITNNGAGATAPLIASLNIVAFDKSTVVDPEDWSPQRTLGVDPIAAGSSVSLSWTVKPVLKGNVAVYVVVMPSAVDLATSGPLAASPAIAVHVDQHRALNPGGVLPVVLAVPGLLALAFAGLRVAGNRRDH